MRSVSFLLLVCFSACTSKHENFSQLTGDSYYRLIRFNDEGKKAARQDWVKLKVQAFNTELTDNIDTAKSINVEYDTITYSSSDPYSLISRVLSVGDSGLFIFPSAKLVNSGILKKGNYAPNLLLAASVEKIIPFREMKKMRMDYLHYKATRLLEEQKSIANYIESSQLNPQLITGGVYIEHISEGSGRPLNFGVSTYISYKGYFLDGNLFFQTPSEKPLEFIFGAPDQVVKGLEIGLKKMRIGGKARIIVPSALAFGEHGSSTGIVGPFQPVIFEVEVLRQITPEVIKR